MRLIFGIASLLVLKLVVAQNFDLGSFGSFGDPGSNTNQNQPGGQNNALGGTTTNTGFNAQMPPIQGPPQPGINGVQFSGQVPNPAANTLTGTVTGQNQAVNTAFAQANTGFGQSSVPGSSFGQLQPANALPGSAAKLTPEQQWLTVGGSRMTQNTNPTLNGNLNNGVPFSSLGFNPNDRSAFQPMNRNQGGQFAGQGGFIQNGGFQQGMQGGFPPNQMRFPQNQGGFQQPQGGFPPRQGPRRQNGGFTNQFETFGTTGNDMMSFNVDAMGPPPSDFSAFGGPTGPNDQDNGPMGPNSLFGEQGNMFGGPGGGFGGPGGDGGMFGGPGGPQGGFGRPRRVGGFDSMGLPPFVRRSMGMGFLGGPSPSPFGFGGSAPPSFVGRKLL